LNTLHHSQEFISSQILLFGIKWNVNVQNTIYYRILHLNTIHVYYWKTVWLIWVILLCPLQQYITLLLFPNWEKINY
jgi:hypothetical protein